MGRMSKKIKKNKTPLSLDERDRGGKKDQGNAE